MLAESLPNNPILLSLYLRFVKNALLPLESPRKAIRIHSFGIMLEPRWIVGTERLDQ
jgi:hypothetical protein